MLLNSNGNTANQNAAIAKEKLDKLPSLIPEIKSWEVGININPSDKSFHLVLSSEFKDDEALKRYKNHPEHIAVLDFFNKVRDKTHYVDYEIQY